MEQNEKKDNSDSHIEEESKEIPDNNSQEKIAELNLIKDESANQDEDFTELDIPLIEIPEEEKTSYRIFGKSGEQELIEAKAAFIAIKLSKIKEIEKIEQVHREFILLDKETMNEMIDKANKIKDNKFNST